MDSRDKTKDNIGVYKLDERTRKELFKKFIDAGGEVVKEKRRRGFTDFDRDKQKVYRYQIEKHAKREKTPKPLKSKDTIITIPEPVKAKPAKRKMAGPIRLFFERFYIRLRLYLMRVTDFYGYYLNPKFLEKFDLEYKMSLIDMQMVFIDIFKQNFKTAKRIIDKLDDITPIYFELIEMISEVFDRTIINHIVEHFLNFPDIPQRVEEIKEPIMAIFKKIYPLYPYQKYLSRAFERSIDLQMKIEKGRSYVYAAKRKKIRNNLYIIFNKLFQRLYWLLCLFEGRIISLMDLEIEEVLSISRDDKPGRRQKVVGIKEIELPLIEKVTEEKVEKEKEVIPVEVKKGLELMYKLNLNQLRERYDRDGIFRYVNETDKILITNLLFKELEEEYSFVLTTNKINYNTISTSGRKLDYKMRLSDLYNELRKCNDSINEYADVLATFEKVRQEKPIGSTQYIEYSNKLTDIERKKNHTGRNARMVVKAFLEKLCDELKVLIDDMEDSQKIIANPQDQIIFELAVEGDKKLNRK